MLLFYLGSNMQYSAFIWLLGHAFGLSISVLWGATIFFFFIYVPNQWSLCRALYEWWSQGRSDGVLGVGCLYINDLKKKANMIIRPLSFHELFTIAERPTWHAQNEQQHCIDKMAPFLPYVLFFFYFILTLLSFFILSSFLFFNPFLFPLFSSSFGIFLFFLF